MLLARLAPGGHRDVTSCQPHAVAQGRESHIKVTVDRLDFRRLQGPVCDPPRRESFRGDECGLIFPNSGWVIEPRR